jgi:predicted AAA+ superfamily ATPase
MEVDFVVETDDELLAIEVKSGGRSRVRGAEAFDKQFKPNKILLVGRDGIPWQEFLQMDAIP